MGRARVKFPSLHVDPPQARRHSLTPPLNHPLTQPTWVISQESAQ